MTKSNRRDFLKWAGLGAGSIFLRPSRSAWGQKVTRVEIAVSHYWSIPGHIPLHLGTRLGFYREAGLEQRVIEFAGGGETVRGLITGRMPYGIPSVTAPIIAFEQGENLRLIGGNDNATPIAFVVRADSPMKTIQGLKGKKVGFSRPGSVTNYLVLKSLMEAPGIDPKDVQMVPVGGVPASWTAVKTGVVDAGWSSFPLMAKILAEGEARILWRSKEYVPDFVETGVVATGKTVKEQGELLRAFLKAHQRAIDYTHANPEETARMWAEAMKIPLDHARIGVKEGTLGLSTRLSVKGLKAIEEGLLEMKLIKKPVPWARFVDQSFLEEKYRVSIPS